MWKLAYAVTSLPPREAGPDLLLCLWRWHWVRDATFNEDRCQVRTGAAAQVMAALCNVTSALQDTGTLQQPYGVTLLTHESRLNRDWPFSKLAPDNEKTLDWGYRSLTAYLSDSTIIVDLTSQLF